MQSIMWNAFGLIAVPSLRLVRLSALYAVSHALNNSTAARRQSPSVVHLRNRARFCCAWAGVASSRLASNSFFIVVLLSVVLGVVPRAQESTRGVVCQAQGGVLLATRKPCCSSNCITCSGVSPLAIAARATAINTLLSAH